MMKTYLFIIAVVFFVVNLSVDMNGQKWALDQSDLDYWVSIENDTTFGVFIMLAIKLRVKDLDRYQIHTRSGQKRDQDIENTLCIKYQDTIYYPMPAVPEIPDGYLGWMSRPVVLGPARIYTHMYWKKSGDYGKVYIRKYYLYHYERFIMELSKPFKKKEFEALSQYFGNCVGLMENTKEEKYSIQQFIEGFWNTCEKE